MNAQAEMLYLQGMGQSGNEQFPRITAAMPVLMPDGVPPTLRPLSHPESFADYQGTGDEDDELEFELKNELDGLSIDNNDDGMILSSGEWQPLRNPVGETSTPELSTIVPSVKKCNWERFVNRFSEDEPVYLIEVLVAGDELGRDMLNEALKRKSSGFFEAATCEKKRQVSKIQTNKKWIQRIRIQSPALLGIFSRLTGYAWAENVYTFMRPFQYLIHFHKAFKDELSRLEGEALEELRDGEKHETTLPYTISHLRAYIRFAEDDILPDFQRFQQLTVPMAIPTPRKIRFTDLWYLFKAGDLMYVPEKTLERWFRFHPAWDPTKSHESILKQKIMQLYYTSFSRVDPMSPIVKSSRFNSYGLSLYHLDYDGASYRPVTYTSFVDYFEGEKDIRDLPVYPLRYASSAEDLLGEARSLGARYTECVKQGHMQHSGRTVLTNPVGLRLPWAKSVFVDSTVIIDFKEAFDTHPYLKENFQEPELGLELGNLGETTNGPDLLALWTDSSRSKLVSVSREVILTGDDIGKLEHETYDGKDRYLGAGADPERVPEGDELALLPPRVFAYSLRNSEFFCAHVRSLNPVDLRGDGFNQLQLPESHRRQIHSSVGSHLRRKRLERLIESRDGKGAALTQDFIPGKGRGLIVLLHGEPGVGKTATAEAVAQEFRRPLFPVSSSQLKGMFATEQLAAIFYLADKWDCILLLDEVDVFLSARTPTDDLERNSLVSGKQTTFTHPRLSPCQCRAH